MLLLLLPLFNLIVVFQFMFFDVAVFFNLSSVGGVVHDRRDVIIVYDDDAADDGVTKGF